MKKTISLFLFLLIMTGMANSQTFTFMGIDIEQSYTSFNKIISSKLGKKGTEGNTSTWYSSAFAGFEGCVIFVGKSSQNTVSDIVVYNRKNLSQEEVIRLVTLYTQKYGQPYQTRPNGYGSTEYQYKFGNHRIQLTASAGSTFHIAYYPRWFVLNTDDI